MCKTRLKKEWAKETTLWSLCPHRKWHLCFLFTSFCLELTERNKYAKILFTMYYLPMALHPLWILATFFSFLIRTQSVGLLGQGISPSQGRYVHKTTQTQNKRAQTFTPRLGFELMIPIFEQEKTVQCLRLLWWSSIYHTDFNYIWGKVSIFCW
jgi:hypothetical protein